MKGDTTHFKTILEAERVKLCRELQSIAEQDPESGKWSIVQTMHDESTNADSNEVADKLEEYETNESIKDKLEAQLKNVEDSLARIEAGTFGICEVCEKEIESDRLEALPSARSCKEHMND